MILIFNFIDTSSHQEFNFRWSQYRRLSLRRIWTNYWRILIWWLVFQPYLTISIFLHFTLLLIWKHHLEEIQYLQVGWMCLHVRQVVLQIRYTSIQRPQNFHQTLKRKKKIMKIIFNAWLWIPIKTSIYSKRSIVRFLQQKDFSVNQ